MWIAQDAVAEPSRVSNVFKIGAIMHISYRSSCTNLIGIPHEVLIEGARIGTSTFGEVREYKIKGISFFPKHITYCGKLYKGDSSKKIDSFQTE